MDRIIAWKKLYRSFQNCAKHNKLIFRNQMLSIREFAALERALSYSKKRSIALAAELATVKAERDALKRAMRDYMNDIFAHTAPPTDWDQETPYGQMLDGLGDEVEP